MKFQNVESARFNKIPTRENKGLFFRKPDGSSTEYSIETLGLLVKTQFSDSGEDRESKACLQGMPPQPYEIFKSATTDVKTGWVIKFLLV